MLSPESSPERKRAATVKQYTLNELQADEKKYQALLATYCEVFKGPPWYEKWWTNDAARQVIEGQLGGKFVGDAFLIEEEDDVIGFYWGCEGDTDDVLEFSVGAFLSRDYEVSTREYVQEKLRSGIRKDQDERGRAYPEKLYYSCEFGILEGRRGVGLGRIFRMGCQAQLEKREADLMYGMTDKGSMLYQVISNRGGRTILPMSELEPENSWVFMVADVPNFVQAR